MGVTVGFQLIDRNLAGWKTSCWQSQNTSLENKPDRWSNNRKEQQEVHHFGTVEDFIHVMVVEWLCCFWTVCSTGFLVYYRQLGQVVPVPDLDSSPSPPHYIDWALFFCHQQVREGSYHAGSPAIGKALKYLLKRREGEENLVILSVQSNETTALWYPVLIRQQAGRLEWSKNASDSKADPRCEKQVKQR